jgi:hypothetical protein
MKSEPVIISAHFAHQTEADLVKRAARMVGMTPSTFLRQLALDRASQIANDWATRQMKNRVANKPELKVIKGGKR